MQKVRPANDEGICRVTFCLSHCFYRKKWYGGAISTSNSAILDIGDSTFDSNFAVRQASCTHRYISINLLDKFAACIQGGSSGAVNFYGLTSMFTRCWFISNSVIDNTDVGLGGAIGMNNGRIVDCTFRHNSAGGSGGAVWTTSDVTIQKCLFDANTAAINGGGVYSNGPLSVGENASFTNCHVTSGNGAALFSMGETDISDTAVQNIVAPATDESTVAFYHAPADGISILALRRVSFINVDMTFVASSEPNKVVIYNCDISEMDVQLTSLLSCNDLEMGNYCANEYCADVAAGIEVGSA